MKLTLEGFYNSYALWLSRDAPWFDPYDRHLGLCDNLAIFCGKDDLALETLGIELETQFKQAKLPAYYPFDNGDDHTWLMNSHAGQMHMNTKRNAWVERHKT